LTAGQPVRAFGRYLQAIIGARHGTTILATDVVDRSLSALTEQPGQHVRNRRSRGNLQCGVRP
jgi:hypothetical protein